MSGPHPSHVTRISMDASTYDEICDNCGATDITGGGWGALARPCPYPADGPCHTRAHISRACERGTHGCWIRHTKRRAE